MTTRLLLGVALLGGILGARAEAGQFVWLEGESGTANVPVKTDGWGNTDFLSGGKWLSVSVEDGKVEKDVPADGALIRYPLTIEKAAAYEVWNRIGYEFARSSFDWRLDGGEWKSVAPDELTTDLMDVSLWCEVAWLKLGDRDLTAGPHTLEIRLPKTQKADGKFNRLLYASDALCLSAGPFRPNSKFKPDETGRDANDEAAAKNVFAVPESQPGQRAAVALAGTWEIARDDEQMPGEVAEPIKALPTAPIFKAIPVPSDKNGVRKDLIFAHRLWYRTRVNVPASMAGRAFYLDFPLNNLNTTVYVNDTYCGFEKDPFCRFQIDITKGVKPGQVNEVWVGIRDATYGRSADPEHPLRLRKTFNYPLEVMGRGFQDFDYPVWNCPQSGILATPTLVAVGSVYTADVFVKPSVEKHALDSEVTLANTAGKDVAGEVRQEVIDDPVGKTVKTFPAQPFAVPAGKRQTVNLGGAWSDPKLWWPDAPVIYRLRTTLVVDGKIVDTQETPFGFREWKIQGTQFTLNGVVWHLWADLVGHASTAEQWLAAFRGANERTHRFVTAGQGPHDPHWFKMEPEAALDFFDRNGVIIRRNATLDGEMIGYQFVEKDPDTLKKQGGSQVKLALMKNWREQCVAQVKGERNHPSIQIWSIENEFAFINLINLLGNSATMDAYEVEIKKAHDAVMAVDPTRSVMTDGGGGLKENTLGVSGDHYVATLDTRYPDLAYEPFVEGGGRGRWSWDMQRPRFIGEDYFATGNEPADFAQWGGEAAFGGKASVGPAVGLGYRILQEGYRWGGYYAAWHFWLAGEGGAASRVANAPRAVLCRQWDWTFGSGQAVTRTFGIFNDTQYPDRLTFTRRLTLGGKEAYAKTSTHAVASGTALKFDESITMPTVKERTEGELVLTLAVDGKELYRDTKAVSVLPAPSLGGIKAGTVAVFDPKGVVAPFLTSLNVPFVTVNDLTTLPESAKVLLVGSDALSGAACASPALSAYASAGRAVVVLDQTTPLKFQGLPAEMELVATNTEAYAASGSTAFIEDASHPALNGLADKDFFTWGPSSVVYRAAYLKPIRGGKSLVQVGHRLAQTALVEMPVGKGVMMVCQLDIGRRLATHAVAQHVVVNLLSSALAYRQEFKAVNVVAQDDQLMKALDSMGLQYAKAADPLAAIGDAQRSIAIVSATPANLAALAGVLDKVRAYWQRGGTLVLHGLTPEGLADYNKIVGVEHVIRPFARERVMFPPVRNPLTAGLSSGDIVLLSGQRIFGFRADEYAVSDEFTYVVDYDDIAPFAKSDFHSYGNIVNGFVGADGWPLIIDFPIPTNGQPYSINLTLPKEETITELTYDQSVNYNPTTKIALQFDGANRQEFDLQPNGDAQTFAVQPHKAKELTLQMCDWQIDPAKTRNQGIDNIWIKVQRSPEFLATVKPMLNVGGLMQYVKGQGGVVLCNLKFQEAEAVPVNKDKKRTILATVLRNLKAPFVTGKTVIPGAHLDCTPIDIHTKATTYKDERGWFGNNSRTFKGLPAGRNTLAGVTFDIYEMPTSPVPQVLMLGGRNVPGNLPKEITGIPVHAKADALFFLHAARIDKHMSDRDWKERKTFVLFNYVVTYADGQKVEVPIRSELDVAHYIQKTPAAIPGAQIAWTRPFENSDDQAVAYAKQWNNPRPDVEIVSVDMIPVDASRGVPVLLALTAVKAE